MSVWCYPLHGSWIINYTDSETSIITAFIAYIVFDHTHRVLESHLRHEGRSTFLSFVLLWRQQYFRVQNRRPRSLKNASRDFIYSEANSELGQDRARIIRDGYNIMTQPQSTLLLSKLSEHVRSAMLGLSRLLRGARNFGKPWSAFGHHEIRYTKCRINTYTYNYTHILTCVFFYTPCAARIQNIPIIIVIKCYKTTNTQVAINKKLIIFKYWFAVLSRIC
jgi:hypothetical protein